MTKTKNNERDLPDEIWARRTPYHTIDARFKFPTVDHSGVEHELISYTKTSLLTELIETLETLKKRLPPEPRDNRFYREAVEYNRGIGTAIKAIHNIQGKE